MRFLIFVIDDKTERASGNEMAAIDAYNGMLNSRNQLRALGGICHGDDATVIDNRNDLGQVAAGSIQQGSEHYSGFWLIDAANHDEALELAKQGSKACNRKVELRPFLGNQ